MIVEMEGNSFVDGRRNRGNCLRMILSFVVSSNTRLHFKVISILESVIREKVTDLIVNKLFVWISFKGSEKAHNVRILTIL